ncbi:hypothetical protein IJ380_02030 [Candidatus Saccharibacteria bacterium]|nr:hypothetical protein [Candidatus Saccharibacteria bacterium]
MTDEKSEKKTEREKLSKGGRNLLILGFGSAFITLLFTFITLKVYHNSGDIYLDRSRPGFLPEKEEVEEDKDDADFSFPDSGKLTKESLGEYLENLKKELDRLNDFSSDPFGPNPLSDETLGI